MNVFEFTENDMILLIEFTISEWSHGLAVSHIFVKKMIDYNPQQMTNFSHEFPMNE